MYGEEWNASNLPVCLSAQVWFWGRWKFQCLGHRWRSCSDWRITGVSVWPGARPAPRRATAPTFASHVSTNANRERESERGKKRKCLKLGACRVSKCACKWICSCSPSLSPMVTCVVGWLTVCMKQTFFFFVFLHVCVCVWLTVRHCWAALAKCWLHLLASCRPEEKLWAGAVGAGGAPWAGGAPTVSPPRGHACCWGISIPEGVFMVLICKVGVVFIYFRIFFIVYS